MRTHIRLFALLVVMCIGAVALGQGIYTETNTTVQAAGGQTYAGQSYFMPKMMKTVTGDQEIIIRLDKQMIYRVNVAEKTYSAMTFEEWEAQMKKASAEMDTKMADLQKKMENMPPEQKKMMEQLLGAQMKGKNGQQPKMDVTNTGEKKTIAGYTATKYVVTQDGKDFLTAWATNDVKGFASMRKDFEEMSTRLASSAPGAGSSMVEAMKKIQGYPLEMEMAMGVKTETTKLELKSISSSEFDVPAGFTKVAMDLNGNTAK